jgi:hypothetical protein
MTTIENVWYKKLATEIPSKFNEYYGLNSEADVDLDEAKIY